MRARREASWSLVAEYPRVGAPRVSVEAEGMAPVYQYPCGVPVDRRGLLPFTYAYPLSVSASRMGSMNTTGELPR
jgi:hypothetical protein